VDYFGDMIEVSGPGRDFAMLKFFITIIAVHPYHFPDAEGVS